MPAAHNLNCNQLYRLQEAVAAYRRMFTPGITSWDQSRELKLARDAIARCDEATVDCLRYMGIMAALVDFEVTADSTRKKD